jgi:hypothetical protein
MRLFVVGDGCTEVRQERGEVMISPELVYLLPPRFGKSRVKGSDDTV